MPVVGRIFRPRRRCSTRRQNETDFIPYSLIMLHVLIAKDLRRTRRNPLPLIINLLIPLVITALVGLAFGGKSDSGALGRIRFALVDEDKSILSDFLRGSANQGEGGKYLE